MFLKEIHLENFRGFNSLSLSFNETGKTRGRTIIIGENGIGKSNLLKAISLVTTGSDALGDLLNSSDNWISIGADSCTIKATIETKDFKERHISLEFKRGDSLKNILFNNSSLNEIDEALNYTKRNYFVVGYGASRRLSQTVDLASYKEKAFRNERSQNVATLFYNDSNLHPLTSWAMEIDYQSDGKNLPIIADALNDLLPNVRFDSIDKINKQLLFKVGKDIIPLNLLSDGYQNVAAWIGDLLYRITETFKDYKNPLNTRGLLLIDEVDLHLHPKWQRLLLNYIHAKLPNMQLIATTHSALTAQQTNQGELFYLQRDDTGTPQIEDFKGIPKQMLIHQLLLSPLFGLTTDESTEVEQLKEEYLHLKNRKTTNTKGKKRFSEISKTLAALPQAQRGNGIVEEEQVKLINDVRKELLSRQKK